jgi:citrate synthase
MSTASVDQYYPGLEGVIASETAISNVEGKHGAGGLEYRGYPIEELAEKVTYLESAYLLLHGELPRTSELASFRARIQADSQLPEPLQALLAQIPLTNHPMDVLRTSVSVLAHFDPEVNASPTDHAANVRKAERMLAKMTTAVAARERITRGQARISTSRPTSSTWSRARSPARR